MEYPGFISPSNRARVTIADTSRMVNLYLERRTVTGLPALYAWPGVTRFATAAEVGGRALFQMNDRALAMMGPGVYGINPDGTVTRFGTVVQDGARGYFTMNGAAGGQALVSSAGNAYVLTLATNVLSAAVLTGEAHQIGMIDGYGVAFNRTLSRIRLSDLNDFSTWDPTQFQARNSAPDNWRAMLINAPNIWLIGSQTGDIWFDAGSFPFPLAPRPGVTFPFGIVAVDSIAAAGDSVLWLSSNAQGAGIVVRARGYIPQRFSNFAVETAIAGYLRDTRIDDAEGMGIQWEGHTLYVLKFPAAGATWLVDLDTGDWQELGSFSPVAGRYFAWQPRAHCLAFGKHLVVDPVTSAIGYLDVAAGTELDGAVQVLLRIPPSLMAHDGARLTVDNFRLKMATGIGTQVGQGADPVAMLRISTDFGKTWGPQLARPLGRIGQFESEPLWTRCGSSEKGWTPEITISDPARPIAIVGAECQGSHLVPPGEGT